MANPCDAKQQDRALIIHCCTPKAQIVSKKSQQWPQSLSPLQSIPEEAMMYPRPWTRAPPVVRPPLQNDRPGRSARSKPKRVLSTPRKPGLSPRACSSRTLSFALFRETPIADRSPSGRAPKGANKCPALRLPTRARV